MESIPQGAGVLPPHDPTVQSSTDKAILSSKSVEILSGLHSSILTADSVDQQNSSQQITRRNVAGHPATGSAAKVLSMSALHAMETPVKTCLLQPYNPKSFSEEQPGIARPFHGVQHACRVSTWAIALLQLRKEMGDPAALSFPDEMIPLLIQACLYHDSGRDGDDDDLPEWERASGNNLAEHLRNSGYSQQIAWQCAEAIRLKDQPELCGQLPESVQTLRSLLHDADTLDVMRVRGTFYMDRLDCFKNCRSETERENVRKLAIEVCKTIADQGDLYSDIALTDHEESTERFYRANGNYCEKTRINWEHHPHPLCNQLIQIGHRSEQLKNLLAPFVTGLHEEQPPFSLSKLQSVEKPLGGTRSEGTGKYSDPNSGDCWYIKRVTCHEDACNQVLVANLARDLGLKVPETFAHKEDGKQYVVCRWMDGLKGGKKILSKLPREQWAKLLLINVIVGNEDITNSVWENIEVDAEGDPVMFDWDWAGLATRYQNNHGKDPGEDDFSSMPVLLTKLRNSNAPNMNSHPITVACQPLLATLSDDELTTALRTLLENLDPCRFNQLIEQSGFRAGDRTWLRQTLWDRIAWLTTRFPNSRDGKNVSEAEYRAIEAAGTRGGWLQVNDTDIPSGQICVEELLDSDGCPQTRMTLRLSGNATRRLSDQLAIERGLHHLQIQSKYFNDTSKQKYSEWRSDLTEIARQSRELATALTNESERWEENHRPTAAQITRQLTTIADQADASLQAEHPEDVESFPKLPDTLPPPAFPGRVTSRLATALDSTVQLAEYSHGFTKLTGKRVGHFDGNSEEQDAQPVPSFELQAEENEQGTITFYAENLPKAQSFERKLIITHPGHSKQTVEALYRELRSLGIQADRADKTNLENHWLDQLAEYQKCREAMLDAVRNDVTDESTNDKKRRFLANRLNIKPEQLDWESHVRIRSGRLVHYRPGLPHNISQHPSALFCPSHNLSFDADQRGQGKMVALMLENEASLSSFERRSDIGVTPFGTQKGLLKQVEYNGASAVFTRIKSCRDTLGFDASGSLTMQLKPAALGRLDATSFRVETSYNSKYSVLEAHRRNKREQLESVERLQNISGRTFQETIYAHPLSLFDELRTLSIGNALEQRDLLRALKKRYSHWPDGRPVEAIFQHSIRLWFFELIGRNSTVPEGVKTFIAICRVQNFEYLINNNPSILQGKLDNLDGLQISYDGYNNCSNLDLRGCSMIDTHLNGVVFDNCHFSAEQLGQARLKNVSLCDCSVEGERFARTTLENVTFYNTAFARDQMSAEEIESITQTLCRSCQKEQIDHASDDTFDLRLWVELLIKNRFLCHHKSPPNRTVLGLMRKYADRIRDEHPEKLPQLLETMLPINFYGREKDAVKFVTNNPLWYEKKINKLDGVICLDFDDWKLSKNSPSELLKWIEPETVMAWLTQFSNFMLATDPKDSNQKLQYGDSVKFNYLKNNHPDRVTECAKSIEAAGRKQLDWGRLPGPALFMAIKHLHQNQMLTSVDIAFWLPILTKTLTDERFQNSQYILRSYYRRQFDYLWQVCYSKQAKIATSKLLMSSSNTDVNPDTAMDAFELLVKEGYGKNFMECFVKKLKMDTYFEWKYSMNDEIKRRISRFEQRLQTKHPDLFQLWQQFRFVPKGTTTGVP